MHKLPPTEAIETLELKFIKDVALLKWQYEPYKLNRDVSEMSSCMILFLFVSLSSKIAICT
ncbi:hypothetical protein DB41_IM00010 [Neochlamydia sp. TUME1]|nr:hypothetical protein DB41_IM00010 [Neochlamydia sp. TUME1]